MNNTSIMCVFNCFVIVEDIDELKGRLKASRQRVADLEKNYTSASSSSHKNEQVSCTGQW